MKYGFTFNKFPIKANDVGLYFEQVQQEIGEVNPKYIVEKAKDESNILHNCFEWNDSKAAELYRIDQARDLIRSLVIIKEDGGKKAETRAVVSVSFGENQPKSYYTIAKVMDSDYAKNMLLNQAMREAEIFKEKYQSLKELSGLISAINKTHSLLLGKIKEKKLQLT